MQKLLLLFFIILAFFSELVSAKTTVPVVGVRIGKSLKNILVSGMDLKRHLLFSNDLKSYSGKQSVKFNCDTYTSLNKERNKPILLATLESSTGVLSFGSEKFHGQFKVVTNPKGDSCDIINDVPMETYIASLLTKEMNPKWPIEALKAQAVAARSYAIHKMKSQQVSKELGNEAFYDLESSEKHQVGGTIFDMTKTTMEASRDTEGEVLVSENGLIQPIFFHSKCGGKTLRPDQVWKNKEDSYESVNCPFCHDIGPKAWNNRITLERMKNFILWAVEKKYIDKPNSNDLNSLIVVPDSMDKYTINFYIGDRPYRIEKGLLRNYFGRFIFPSNSFSLKANGTSFEILGEGLGHNVGMCQMGAFALAKMGWSYKKILSHYFPKHVLKKMY